MRRNAIALLGAMALHGLVVAGIGFAPTVEPSAAPIEVVVAIEPVADLASVARAAAKGTGLALGVTKPRPFRERPIVAQRPKRSAPQPLATPAPLPAHEAFAPDPDEEPDDDMSSSRGGDSEGSPARGDSGTARTQRDSPARPASMATPSAASIAALENAIQTRAKRMYPLMARRRGLEGRVELELEMHPNGHLAQLKIVESAGALLDRAARAAVESAVPLPYVAGPIRIPVSFTLH